MERNANTRLSRLDQTGLVAFPACGHWWTYAVRATPEQMHAIARFNLGVMCRLCYEERRTSSPLLGAGTATRVN
jgi:hypothetical protein